VSLLLRLLRLHETQEEEGGRLSLREIICERAWLKRDILKTSFCREEDCRRCILGKRHAFLLLFIYKPARAVSVSGLLFFSVVHGPSGFPGANGQPMLVKAVCNLELLSLHLSSSLWRDYSLLMKIARCIWRRRGVWASWKPQLNGGDLSSSQGKENGLNGMGASALYLSCPCHMYGEYQ